MIKLLHFMKAKSCTTACAKIELLFYNCGHDLGLFCGFEPVDRMVLNRSNLSINLGCFTEPVEIVLIPTAYKNCWHSNDITLKTNRGCIYVVYCEYVSDYDLLSVIQMTAIMHATGAFYATTCLLIYAVVCKLNAERSVTLWFCSHF